MLWLLLLLFAAPAVAADYAAPAGARPALRGDAESVLPGGRLVTPVGRQYVTGPGPFGLAISPDGSLLASANGGPDRYSLTILQKQGGEWTARQLVAPRRRRDQPREPGEDDWRSVFMGLAFHGNGELYAAEGNSGRVRVIDPRSGSKLRIIELNQGGYQDSYSGDLALDPTRPLLYVLDQANFRLAVVNTETLRVTASVRLGRLPFALALAPDGRKAYVTNIGMFEYRPVPGADPKRARETGLPFPAFGFPSAEARNGARRQTTAGPVDVPGLGDPNAPESNSLAIVDLAGVPRLEALVRTGLPFGPRSLGGSSPSGVAVADGDVFVSNGHNDSITVIDSRSHRVRATVPIRIPGLEPLRGVLPIGLSYDPEHRWLLIAEAGINAVGILDVPSLKLLGHVPVGWFPTRARADRGRLYVVNAKGRGTGPNHDLSATQDSFAGALRRGSISIAPLPPANRFAELTARVMRDAGFVPQTAAAPTLPRGIRYVVLIVKENRTFDEVFGDLARASNGPVAGLPALARFGSKATATADRRGPPHPPLKDVNVSPNHHALAARYAFSDNFYADSEVSVDGHHWVVGSYPNAWTESSLMASYGGEKNFRFPTTAPGRLAVAESNSSVHPEEQLEAGAIWHHLERHGISFRNFGEGFELAGVDEGPGLAPTGARYVTNVPIPEPLFRNTSREYPQFNMNIPDQYRATQFISEVERKYVRGGEAFPRFLFLHLPQDHTAKTRPGYPFPASYMADNDYALGRIIEYLSHSRWWREMAVFVTEDDAQGWVDHVDSHRTVLLVAGPYTRRDYVSHVNSSFPGLLKTVFRLLGLPPLNLFDAGASDLSDCFGEEPDFTPYRALPIDPALFDAAKVKDPLDAAPDSPRMDDPRVLDEQHRQARERRTGNSE